jgi:hypothetical protein
MFSVKKLILQNRRSRAAIAHSAIVDWLLLRATGGGLNALRRREAVARRRQAFIARRAGERVAAGANQRGRFLDSVLYEASRVLRRRSADGCAFRRNWRVISAPLQGDADEENANRAFGEKNQHSSPSGKAVFFVSDVAARLSLRKRSIDSFPESYGNKMQTMSMRRRATGEAFASA